MRRSERFLMAEWSDTARAEGGKEGKEKSMATQSKSSKSSSSKKPQVKVSDLKASKNVTGGRKNNKKGGKSFNVN